MTLNGADQQMESAAAKVSTGCRVDVGGFKGTVRFIGEVEGQTGFWAGIEWDDETRGKHDGSTGGVRYFECTSGGNSASFVRFEKVRAGRALDEALKERYCSREGLVEQDMVVQTAGHRQRPVELVGTQKVQDHQSQLNLLVAARACSCGVATAGDGLSGLAPALRELDLTDNLLASWAEVSSICGGLPALTELNLSGNRLPPPPPGLARLPAAAPLAQLHTLVLNAVRLPWRAVLQLADAAPALQQLHCCGNAVDALAPPPPPASLPALRVLNLDDNCLQDWQQVEALARLPSLTRLQLNGNPLRAVCAPAAPDAFANLQALLLGRSAIDSWASVDALDSFLQLREVRLSGTPLMQVAHAGGRYEVIGRVARLTWVNGSEVRPRERADSELRYLRATCALLAGCKGDAAEESAVRQRHPRLARLLELYGPVEDAAEAAPGGAASGMAVMRLRLTCVAPSAGKKMGSLEKKLPVSTTIAKLKELCAQLFKLDVNRVALFLQSMRDPVPQDVGTDDTCDLRFLTLSSDHELLVDEKPA